MFPVDSVRVRLPSKLPTRTVSFQQVATVAQLRDFDEVVDVRSPAEFALDHCPGALNCPVLDDEERALVGTVYKQQSAFAAKRIGAALAARNIARHIESTFQDRAPNWRPLVYCWRGGGRSDAMCEVLRRIGWRAVRLQGGYQAYRRAVVADLLTFPSQHRFCVICGKTGSAKSRILGALAHLDAQVLDLEQLACHRGSVLGEIPGSAQPTQKMFESFLWQALSRLHANKPVFVEAESRKVGNVQVPGALISAMRAAPCVVVEVPEAVRIGILIQEYRHFLQDPASLCRRLDALSAHYGHAAIGRWKNMAHAAAHEQLVAELLRTHYDPAYERSARRNFPQLCSAPIVSLSSADDATLREAALGILAHCRSESIDGRLCR